MQTSMKHCKLIPAARSAAVYRPQQAWGFLHNAACSQGCGNPPPGSCGALGAAPPPGRIRRTRVHGFTACTSSTRRGQSGKPPQAPLGSRGALAAGAVSVKGVAPPCAVGGGLGTLHQPPSCSGISFMYHEMM